MCDGRPLLTAVRRLVCGGLVRREESLDLFFADEDSRSGSLRLEISIADESIDGCSADTESLRCSEWAVCHGSEIFFLLHFFTSSLICVGLDALTRGRDMRYSDSANVISEWQRQEDL